MKNTNIVEIPLSSIFAHPDNPRKNLGDLTELAESIQTNGILQNLTVVRNKLDDTYTVIIGHRRLAAAKLAGLTTVPCVVTEMTDEEELATMLTENMQRSDLTVYEQAEGIQLLLDYSFSIADISKKTGLSQSTIRRRTKLLELDKEAFAQSQQRQVSLSDYEKLNEIEDIDTRNRLLDVLGTNDFNYEFERELRYQKSKNDRKELLNYLETLPNVKQSIKRRASIWCYAGILYSVSDAKKKIKQNKEYCYEDESYGVSYYRKRTDEEIERDQQEEQRRELSDRFRTEARELNSTTRNLRKRFIENPPKLNKEQYYILVKEFVRGRINSAYWSTPKCLNGSTSNFDSVFESDNGVKIMLEIIASKMDMGINCDYITGLIDEPYRVSESLNSFYYLLTRLGYVMSDEEKQLRDGTHPIFTKYKGKA